MNEPDDLDADDVETPFDLVELHEILEWEAGIATGFPVLTDTEEVSYDG